MRRIALLGGWVAVVILMTTLTWQIVGAADDRVSERPASPLNVAAPLINTAAGSTIAAPPTSTTADPGPSATAPASPSSSTAGSTAITPGVTSTSQPATTTSTTTPQWQVKSTTTAGGSVVVKYRPGEVVLQAASPAPGFRAEIEKAGPPLVEVEFESEKLKIEFKAEWEHGELEVDISESSDS